MAVVLSLVLSFAVSNAVHPGLGANEKLALCDRGGREADFIELISMQDLELRAGLDYESCALFAQTEQPVVVGPRRRNEIVGHPPIHMSKWLALQVVAIEAMIAKQNVKAFTIRCWSLQRIAVRTASDRPCLRRPFIRFP